MKNRSALLTGLMVAVLAVQTFAQPMVVVGTNASKYPEVAIRAYGFANNGDLESIEQGQVMATQDGTPVPLTATQEPATGGRNISVFVCADVSGPGRAATPSALALMTSAATRVTAVTENADDELALGSFAVSPMLLCGMTANEALYIDALKDLKLGSGSKQTPPLTSAPLGALVHLQSARNSRVLLLMVNGAQSFDLSAALSLARSFHTQVFVIGVLSSLSAEHKALADSTDGLWIENVTSTSDIEILTSAYLAHAKNLPRSILTFTSPDKCASSHTVNLRRVTFTTSTSYTPSGVIVPTLEWSRSGLDFGTLPESSLESVTLTARNAPVTISNTTIDDPAFTITTPITPGTVLQPDQSITITVRYAGGVDGVFGILTLATDGCGVTPLYLRAGSLNSGETLTLLKPNGNELFYAGIDTEITWTNALPSDYVRIELSRDNGATWAPIVENATGLKYVWTPGPLTTNQGRIRVQRTSVDENSILTLTGHRDPVYSVDFSNDDKYAFTGGHDFTVRMWDSNTGQAIRQIGTHQGWVWCIAAHPSATMVASGSHDGSVRVWDYETGVRVLTIPADSRVWSVDYNPDGTRIAFGSESSLTIVNSTDGGDSRKVALPEGRVQTVRYSEDGTRLLITAGNVAKVLDATTLEVLRTFTGHTDEIYAGAIAPDNSTIVTGGADYTVRLWNANTGASIATTSAATASILDADYAPNGGQILIAGGDGTAKLYNTTTLALLNSLAGHSGLIYGGRFDASGERIATAATDATARIWTIRNATLTQDASDGPFRVVGGLATTVAIDHGSVEIGRGSDKVAAALSNTGSNDLTILGYRITTGDVSDFDVMQLPSRVILQPDSVLNVETVFAPTASGNRLAKLTVYTGTGNVDVEIKGIGANPQLNMPEVVNFGRHVANQSVVDTTITIRSGFNVSVTRTSLVGVQSGSYQILSGGGSFNVSPSSPRDLRLRFEPIEFGRFAARVELTLSDGSTRTINLYGEGTGDARIQSSASSLLFVTDRCNAAPTEQTVKITNGGTSTMRLFSGSVAGANADEFAVITPSAFPVDIAPGASTDFKIRFTPQVAGSKDARLVIASNAIDAENGSTTIGFVARKDSVVFELSTNNLVFENVPEGQSALQKLLIINTGTVALRWPTNVVDLGDFVIQSVDPSVTSAGGQSEVTVRFKGGSVGTTYTDSYTFTDTICNRSETLQISATVASYTGFTIKIDTVAGNIGSEVTVPVRIINKVNLEQSGITEVQARLSVNGTILTPTSDVTNSTFLADGTRHFVVTLPVPSSGDVSTQLRFRTSWGNDTASFIRVDSIWATQELTVRQDAGQVILSDLCKQGGPRLFIQDGPNLLKGASVRIAPQPAVNETLVELNVVENGPTRVDLVDMTGRIALTLVDRNLVPGRYTLPFDASTLETGAYTIVISTRTQRMSNRFSVVR